jgi:hypothetical protein
LPDGRQETRDGRQETEERSPDSRLTSPVCSLGRLVSSHSTSPVYLQRAAIVAFIAFVFFLALLVAFYVRQHVGYFLLSTAFLIVYVFTLIGWLMQKRNVVSIYENGLKYKNFRAAWDEIRSLTANGEGLEIVKNKRERTLIPPSVIGYGRIVQAVKQGVKKRA